MESQLSALGPTGLLSTTDRTGPIQPVGEFTAGVYDGRKVRNHRARATSALGTRCRIRLLGMTPAEAAVRRVVSCGAFDLADVVDIGGWGGDFLKGHRWLDYLALVDAKLIDHFEALRHAILRRGLRRGGDWHQAAPDGTPIFDDGVVATFSFRAWGDLMAAVWVEEDNRDYWYMDFYMDCCIEDAGIQLSPPLYPPTNR